jgi:hypothetical protein
VTLDHSGSSGHRLEQFSGLSPHRLHPRAPVSEQLPGLPDILPLVDARIAFGWPLCRSNSAAKAAQTEASLPGVAKGTLLASRSANTVR